MSLGLILSGSDWVATSLIVVLTSCMEVCPKQKCEKTISIDVNTFFILLFLLLFLFVTANGLQLQEVGDFYHPDPEVSGRD